MRRQKVRVSKDLCQRKKRGLCIISGFIKEPAESIRLDTWNDPETRRS
jgi:hypothetical protein